MKWGFPTIVPWKDQNSYSRDAKFLRKIMLLYQQWLSDWPFLIKQESKQSTFPNTYIFPPPNYVKLGVYNICQLIFDVFQKHCQNVILEVAQPYFYHLG